MKFKSGQVFEFNYPFFDQVMADIGGDKQSWLTPGCHKYEEQSECYYNFSFTANYEGKVVFEVLSIAEMPGKYMDRLVVKKYYVLPNGERFSSGSVDMITTGKMNKFIETKMIFPYEYEVDEDAVS